MKRLQLYYWYLGIPVALVFLGAVIFWDAIISTVEGNPHPQINYIIFLLVAVGCYQMMSHVRRINKEGSLFRQYRRMVDGSLPDAELEATLYDISKKTRCRSFDAIDSRSARQALDIGTTLRR